MIRRFILGAIAALVAVSAHAQAIDTGARSLALRALTAAKTGGAVGSVQCSGSNGFVACTSTGSGLVVQATSPTLVTPELGAFTGLAGAIVTNGSMAGNNAAICMRQSGAQTVSCLSAGGLTLGGNKVVSFGPNTADSIQDLILQREAANIAAWRSGTSPQCERWYNTWTDSLNLERLKVCWAGNVATIAPEALGTGTLRAIVVSTPTTVSGLPTCNSGAKGAQGFVTDANSTTFLAAVAGSGSNNVPVICDGTSWKIG